METAAGKIENTGCNCGCHHGDASEGEGLSMKRAASDFEALRLATELPQIVRRSSCSLSEILQCVLARAQFSTNFFGCAGYEIIDNLGFDTVQQGVDAALEKGCR